MYGSTLFRLLLALISIRLCFCWSQEELDLFDLVEEIPENFYSLLQVDQTASSSEIRRSYRQLSLQLHPDKSDDPDAAEKFRKLVAVAEVLRDEELRASYDIILRDGLPDWKQPLYYYRRVRKMGLWELSVFLLIILTVAQYIFGWAVYVEKLLVLQEVVSRKQKKDDRKSSRKSSKSNSYSSLEAELEYCTQQADASIPRLKNLLPVLLAKKLLTLIQTFWRMYCQWRYSNTHTTSQITSDELNETSETHSSDKFKKRDKRVKTQKPTVPQQHQSTNKTESTNDRKLKTSNFEVHSSTNSNNGSTSTSLLAQDPVATKCHVSNNTESERVSETLIVDGRESTNRKRESFSTDQSSLQEDDHNQNGNQDDSSSPRQPMISWSQYQQVQLEWALTAYPKFSVDRWENIAKAVPGKTKEECMKRCMELFEAVKRRKGLSAAS